MAQAKIYWDLENYSQVEKIFRKSVEFCNESDIWKLNVAHVLFMQENKFKEATGFYEPIVKKNYDNVSRSECGERCSNEILISYCRTVSKAQHCIYVNLLFSPCRF